MFDTHLHTKYSGDSDSEPPLLIEKAKSIGLSGLVFTDHYDLDYKIEPDLFNLNIPAYITNISSLKDSYQDFHIGVGIELGLQPHLSETYSNVLSNYDFDFCIGSVHGINGLDPYYDEFFEGLDISARFHEYFEYVLENINTFSQFDSLGHLDYIIRYANDFCLRNGMALVAIEEDDLIREILAKVINMDKCLEVNTGSFRYGFKEPNPSYDILRTYYSMGGRLITLGSDAHRIDEVGIQFDEVTTILKEIGFKSQMVFDKRIPTEYPI